MPGSHLSPEHWTRHIFNTKSDDISSDDAMESLLEHVVHLNSIPFCQREKKRDDLNGISSFLSHFAGKMNLYYTMTMRREAAIFCPPSPRMPFTVGALCLHTIVTLMLIITYFLCPGFSQCKPPISSGVQLENKNLLQRWSIQIMV